MAIVPGTCPVPSRSEPTASIPEPSEMDTLLTYASFQSCAPALVAMNDENDESVLIHLEKLHAKGEITDDQFERLIADHYAAKATAEAVPVGEPQSVEPERRRQPPVRSAVEIGVTGTAMVLGSFMPWATIGLFSIAGTRGDGALTAILGLGVVGAAIVWGLLSRKSAPLTALVLCVLGVILTVNVYNNLGGDTIGIGLFVVGIASLLGALVSADAVFRPRQN